MERVVLSGPLSDKSSFRLIVDGDWSVRECNRVLSILDVIVGHLREDKADAANSMVTLNPAPHAAAPAASPDTRTFTI